MSTPAPAVHRPTEGQATAAAVPTARGPLIAAGAVGIVVVLAFGLLVATRTGWSPHEMPVVRDIVRKTAPGYKMDDIVQAIVHSNPFTMRTAAGGQS